MTDQSNITVTQEMVEQGEVAKRWASVLGLSDERIVIDFSSDHDKSGTVSYHNNYNNSVITLRDGPHDDPWPFEDQEETIVHELVHIVLRDMSELVERRILPQLPKATRKVCRGLWSHELERAVETISRSLVAAKRGDAETGKMMVRPQPKGVE